MSLQVLGSNASCNLPLPDNNTYILLVKITPEYQVSFSLDDQAEPICSMPGTFDSSSGYLSWSGNGGIDDVLVTRP